jgi:hypothetical protein
VSWLTIVVEDVLSAVEVFEHWPFGAVGEANAGDDGIVHELDHNRCSAGVYIPPGGGTDLPVIVEAR